MSKDLVKRSLRRAALALGIAAAVSACGGNDAATTTARTARPLAADAPATYDADALMQWAEQNFAALFPGPQPTRELPPYVYRYYPQTQNYLGVAGESIAVLGPVSGGELLVVGTMAQFRCRVRPEFCVGAVAPRVVAGQNLMAAIAGDGRVFVWGPQGSALLPEGGATAAGDARLLAARGHQVGITEYGAMVLGLDGVALGWGRDAPRWLYDSSGAASAARSPGVIPWPRSVQQVSQWTLSAVALLDDGSVWSRPLPLPPEPPTSFGSHRVPGLPEVKALSTGTGLPHAVLADGRVMSFGSGFLPQLVANAANVRALACGGAGCLARTTAGSALAWGSGPLGSGTVGGSTAAIVVPGVTGIVQVAAGGASADAVFAVLGADGLVRAWGQQNLGRDRLPRLVPEVVPGLDHVTDIDCAQVCLARRSDGTVWTWHVGNVGPTALSTYPPRGFPPPQQVTGVLVP